MKRFRVELIGIGRIGGFVEPFVGRFGNSKHKRPPEVRTAG